MIATSGQYIFTVSEVNQFIKDLLDNVPPLQEVLLRGEISNYKLYPSGHHYFTLKDSQCSLKCVMFRGSAARLRFRPENGMQVIASGRISVYPRDGAYQLYCTGLTPEGAGDLSVAFEQLKEKLRKVIPPEEANNFCHRMVLHGRALCMARKPDCENCALRALCDYGSTAER